MYSSIRPETSLQADRAMTEKETFDPFLDLDWNTLEEWAGAKTLSRGRQYQREKRVHDLVRSTDGALVAWVDGVEQYATAVTFGGSLTSVCTCPVGPECKHAVAIVLEYLALRKDNKPVRNIPADDPRLSLLGINTEKSPAEDPCVTSDGPLQTGGQNLQQNPERSRRKQISLPQFLEGLSKKELISLLDELIRAYPQVQQEIADRKSVATADADPVLDALLSDIDHITGEDAWSNSWNGESQIPDYSPVKKRMEILLSMGFPDAVVNAGGVLMKKGAAQVDRSNDEGETADGIASCMDLVFQALSLSSLPAHERMLFAILAELDDGYDLCSGADRFWEEKFPDRDWGLVADGLLLRLGKDRYDHESRKHGSRYNREQLVGWIMTALDLAGREDESTDLSIAEVGRTDSYVRLVRRLLRLGRGDEAREWIARGITSTGKSLPGIAADLRTIRRELWEQEGDWLSVAGVRAGEFLSSPSFSKYRQLEKSAQKAGLWDSVKNSVMQYLQDGKLPVKRREGPGETGLLFGYLPDAGLTRRESWKAPGSPFFDVLIDIAIADKRPDVTIAWYDLYREAPEDRKAFYHSDDKVADFVADKFPDRALAIWMMKAERFAAESRPKSYEASVGYLNKIRALMKKQGREEEWGRYVAQVRNANARKKRFLEMLDVVEGKKILKS